jgi:hypothetical protein
MMASRLVSYSKGNDKSFGIAVKSNGQIAVNPSATVRKAVQL